MGGLPQSVENPRLLLEVAISSLVRSRMCADELSWLSYTLGYIPGDDLMRHPFEVMK